MKKAPTTEAVKRHTQDQYSTAPAGGYSELKSALLDADVVPLNIDQVVGQLVDGRLIRFKTASKPGKRNGWIVAHFDQGVPVVVIAGDWGTGSDMKWVASTGDTMTAAERRQLKIRIQKARREREEQEHRKHEDAALHAKAMWHKAAPASADHEYLVSKGISANTARQINDCLVLPLIDFTGKLWSLQTINPQGKKLLLAGGKKAGHFIVVRPVDYPKRILICEGWATGCTLAEQMPECLVLAAIDAGNLATVAKAARKNWPEMDLVICGDDDRQTEGNPGATAARNAAIAAHCRFALPEWPEGAPEHLSDFNDLASWQRGKL
ncbi:MAG: toprim domain-containing protein [Marinobacter sp.]|nr:toprim domain-containing protein [Marinobacter sp.]